jgi:hypothetical protein
MFRCYNIHILCGSVEERIIYHIYIMVLCKVLAAVTF